MLIWELHPAPSPELTLQYGHILPNPVLNAEPCFQTPSSDICCLKRIWAGISDSLSVWQSHRLYLNVEASIKQVELMDYREIWS